jgi:hypothetical protein
VSGGRNGACVGDSNVDRYIIFYGGSRYTKEEINTAVGNGVVKMNVENRVGIRVNSPEIFVWPVLSVTM